MPGPRRRPAGVAAPAPRERAGALGALLLAALLGHGSMASAAPIGPPAAPAFEPCELYGSAGQGRVSAECARFVVPENRADPAGPRLELFVARLPALAAEPAADAVTLINGGPGASSVSLYVDLEPAFAALRRERDIVLVDQRGTGRSAPLDCPTLEEATYRFDADLVRRTTRACLDSLTQDPRFFTTSVAVEDLEALRRALGYSAWNVYGVSYGTRVAQHYLQRFPDAVRTMTLDGVVPPGLPLGPDVAVNAQGALDAILQRCAAVDYCAAAFPDLAASLRQLRERLTRDPVALQVAHPVTGRAHPLTLRYTHLAMAIRLLSYAPETAALIPLIIDEAANRGNYVPLAGQALSIERQLETTISFGMHNSVVCTEDVPFYHDLDTLWPTLEASYLGPDQVRALQAICALWPRGQRHPLLGELVRSDKPVLLLSGEHDPITPPAYAERAATDLGNAVLVTAPGQGHGVVGRGCIPQLLADLVDSGTVSGLDTRCVRRLEADAFFVDLLGPPP